MYQNVKIKINGMIGCKEHIENGRIFKRSGMYWSSIHTYFSHSCTNTLLSSNKRVI